MVTLSRILCIIGILSISATLFGQSSNDQTSGLVDFTIYSTNFMRSLESYPFDDSQSEDYASQIDEAIATRNMSPELREELDEIVVSERGWSLHAIALLVHCDQIQSVEDLPPVVGTRQQAIEAFAAAYLIAAGKGGPEDRSVLFRTLNAWSAQVEHGALPFMSGSVYRPTLIVSLPIVLEEDYSSVKSLLPVFLMEPLLDVDGEASLRAVFLDRIVSEYAGECCDLLRLYLEQGITQYMPKAAERPKVIRSGDYSSLVSEVLKYYRELCPNSTQGLSEVRTSWEDMVADLNDVSEEELPQLLEEQQEEHRSTAEMLRSGKLDAKDLASFLKTSNESTERLRVKIARTWTYGELLDSIAALESTSAETK
ncbi:hypothetical protein KQI84_19095 [bacterium]|nr:hypothetical protein [bacterium]